MRENDRDIYRVFEEELDWERILWIFGSLGDFEVSDGVQWRRLCGRVWHSCLSWELVTSRHGIRRIFIQTVKILVEEHSFPTCRAGEDY